MTLEIRPTGEVCGAVVTGIDLSKPLSDDMIAALRSAWLEHHILIYPDQRLTPQQLADYTLQFGPFGVDTFFGAIDEHPNIAAICRRADEKAPVFAETFHTDWSFQKNPPIGTCLYGITIPPHGGDTLFVNQHLAYENLPEPLKSKIEGLTAIHSAAFGYAPDGLYGDADQASDRSMDIRPSEKALETQQHPLIKAHPETGRKAIYSSLAYIKGFVGMEQGDAIDLLQELYAYQTSEPFLFRHKWEPNMLLMWDNRSLLHAATGGYDGHDRLLHRTTIGSA